MFDRILNSDTSVHTVQARARGGGFWYAFHLTAGEVGVAAALWLVWVASRMTRYDVRRRALGPNVA